MKKFQILLLLLLGLILSEGFLQLVSAVVIYRSDRPQTFNLQKNDEIRILCLGESTTALGGKDSYPRQLERILQERLRSKTIKVINLGSPNFHTDKILEKIPLWLEEYRPQIVISMMGINDFWNSSRSHHLFSAGLRKIKILKLIDFAYINWTFRERNALVENGEENYGPFIVNPVYPQKIDRAVKLAKEKNWKMAKVLLNKVIVKTANRVAVATEIWNLYEDPKNTELLDLIEDLLRETKLEKDALAEANRLRGMIEIKNGDTEKAVLFFRQAHQQGLLNPAFLDQYANALTRSGSEDLALKLQLENRQLCQRYRDKNCFLSLLHSLSRAKRYQIASEVLEEAKLAVPNLELFHYVSRFPIEEYLDRVNDHPEKMFNNSKLVDNYRALISLLKEKRVISLAVQYPTLNPTALVSSLKGSGASRIIGNKLNFEEAIERSGFDSLFIDRFGTSFGHFTPKGAELLAKNITSTLIPLLN